MYRSWLIWLVFLGLGLSLNAQLIPYRKGELWGIIDKYGDLVVPCRYETVSFFAPGYFIYGDAGFLMGLMDAEGNVLTPPVYTEIMEMSDGLLLVLDENYQYGAIDLTGKIIIPLAYDYIMNFQQGLALASKNGTTFLLNNAGKIIKSLPGNYTYGAFKDAFYNIFFDDQGYKAIMDNKTFSTGVLDPKGKIVVPAIYDAIQTLKEGLFIVTRNDLYGAVNSKGKIIIPLEYDYLGTPSDGRIPAAKNGQYGYLDLKGKTAVPFLYQEAFSFKNGKAIVRMSNGYTLIDVSGRVVWKGVYESIRPAGNHYVVRRDWQVALMDTAENLRTEFIYDHIRVISLNRFEVSQGETCGMIDANGKEWISLEYEGVGHKFYYGLEETFEFVELWSRFKKTSLFPVYDGNYYAVFDTNGKQLTPFIYESAFPEFPEGLVYITNTSGRAGYVGTGGKEYFEEPLRDTFVVSSVKEFYQVLGNDRVIILTPGKYDFSLLPVSQSPYENNVFYGVSYPGIVPELSLFSISNLTIRAEEPHTVEIIHPDPAARTLVWTFCHNILLENLDFIRGGTIDTVYANMMTLDETFHFYTDQCSFSGGAATGIVITGGKNMNFIRTTVRDCREGILSVEDLTYLNLTECIFENNTGPDLCRLYEQRYMNINRCVFRNNQIDENGFLFAATFEERAKHTSGTIRLGHNVFEKNSAGYLGTSPDYFYEEENTEIQNVFHLRRYE